jgi:hypothetical protein
MAEIGCCGYGVRSDTLSGKALYGSSSTDPAVIADYDWSLTSCE